MEAGNFLPLVQVSYKKISNIPVKDPQQPNILRKDVLRNATNRKYTTMKTIEGYAKMNGGGEGRLP